MSAKNKGGRPQRIPGHALKRLTVNLGPDHMQAVRDIADLRGTSMSQAVEWALGIAAASITKQQWKALEAIRDARQA